MPPPRTTSLVLAVALLVSALALWGLASPARGFAAADPGWWEQFSPGQQRTLANSFYAATGRPVPFSTESASSTTALRHLHEGTPVADVSEAATQQARVASVAALVPTQRAWVPTLARVAGAGGVGASAAVVLSAEIRLGFFLYAKWTMNDDMDVATGFTYNGLRWSPPGEDIFFGATSRGEYLYTAWGWPLGVRWFEPPCTFTGFAPPAGARMRVGATTTARCVYSIPEPPYQAEAPVFVQYPYRTELDLLLESWLKVAPLAELPPYQYSQPNVPAPAITEGLPDIEAALEEAGNELIRGRLEIAVVAETLQRNNLNSSGQPQIGDEEARKIAKSCIEAVRLMNLPINKCGSSSLPILVLGNEAAVGESKAHIVKALGTHYPWYKLRYKQRSSSEKGWTRLYPETDPTLPNRAMSCVGTATDTACDEFPFLATEQGGATANPLAHLEIIDYDDNRQMGSWYGSRLVTKCKMAARRPSPPHGNGWFLVVPAPVAVTMGYCNGPNP